MQISTSELIPSVEGLVAARGFSRKAADQIMHQGVLTALVTRANGRAEKMIYGYNARVNTGAAAQAANLFGTPGSIFAYFACTPTTVTPAIGDTALTGEITTGGFVRALAAYTYTAPTTVGGTYVALFNKVFTGTGAWTVNSIALFNQLAIGGIMYSEIALTSSAGGALGDTLTLNYSVTQ